ncbi:MAG: FliA/WhiG family RNA polymerase sigma factor [Syntrophomonadaceae bacterium]|nr:FliA/WhiG family RNA polymerase sigma factor [Syntrophomonadaceae bacterium]
MGEPKIEQLWLRYKQQKDVAAREKLIIHYVYLVHRVAGRLSLRLSTRVELDDLTGFGVFGLLDAIEKYDLSRGVKFETYATTRIRGAILDGLRSMDWVPQSIRQKTRMLERTYLELEQDLGRSATDQEMAQALDLSLNQYEKMLQEVSYTSLYYLEDLWPGEASENDSLRIMDTIEDSRLEEITVRLEYEETKALLIEAIDKLPERERLVISLYYYEQLTLKEIGAVIGLSESRISQLHTKAILRLRGRLSRRKKKIYGE